jgi:hypothetical protein
VCQGAVSLIAGVAIVMVLKSRKKKRAQLAAEVKEASEKNENPFDRPESQNGVTTQISASPAASPNQDPFLTPGEKAIIDSMSLPDDRLNVNQPQFCRYVTY